MARQLRETPEARGRGAEEHLGVCEKSAWHQVRPAALDALVFYAHSVSRGWLVIEPFDGTWCVFFLYIYINVSFILQDDFDSGWLLPLPWHRLDDGRKERERATRESRGQARLLAWGGGRCRPNVFHDASHDCLATPAAHLCILGIYIPYKYT